MNICGGPLKNPEEKIKNFGAGFFSRIKGLHDIFGVQVFQVYFNKFSYKTQLLIVSPIFP